MSSRTPPPPRERGLQSSPSRDIPLLAALKSLRKLREGSIVPPTSAPTLAFPPFAKSPGMVVNPLTLPYFRMGSNAIWDTMPYLGWRARALSIVKQDFQFEEPDMLSFDSPLWHSTMFINKHKQSYFLPRLIRQGILTVGQLPEDDPLFALIAPPWLSIYKDRISNHCSRHALFQTRPSHHRGSPAGTCILDRMDPFHRSSFALTPALLGAKAAGSGVDAFSKV